MNIKEKYNLKKQVRIEKNDVDLLEPIEDTNGLFYIDDNKLYPSEEMFKKENIDILEEYFNIDFNENDIENITDIEIEPFNLETNEKGNIKGIIKEQEFNKEEFINNALDELNNVSGKDIEFNLLDILEQLRDIKLDREEDLEIVKEIYAGLDPEKRESFLDTIESQRKIDVSAIDLDPNYKKTEEIKEEEKEEETEEKENVENNIEPNPDSTDIEEDTKEELEEEIEQIKNGKGPEITEYIKETEKLEARLKELEEQLNKVEQNKEEDLEKFNIKEETKVLAENIVIDRLPETKEDTQKLIRDELLKRGKTEEEINSIIDECSLVGTNAEDLGDAVGNIYNIVRTTKKTVEKEEELDKKVLLDNIGFLDELDSETKEKAFIARVLNSRGITEFDNAKNLDNLHVEDYVNENNEKKRRIVLITPKVKEKEEVEKEVLVSGIDRLEYPREDIDFIKSELNKTGKYTPEEIEQIAKECEIVATPGVMDNGYDNPIQKVNIVRNVKKKDKTETTEENKPNNEELLAEIEKLKNEIAGRKGNIALYQEVLEDIKNLDELLNKKGKKNPEVIAKKEAIQEKMSKLPENLQNELNKYLNNVLNKKRGLKVAAKRALNWMKEHKLATIAIGLGALALTTGLLFAIPTTHMMINSALWNLGSSLGWSSSTLNALHTSNLALAKAAGAGKYAFEGMSGLYTLGGSIGAAPLYTSAGANIVGALAGLVPGVMIAGTLGAGIKKAVTSIKEKIEKKKSSKLDKLKTIKDKVKEKLAGKDKEKVEEKPLEDIETVEKEETKTEETNEFKKEEPKEELSEVEQLKKLFAEYKKQMDEKLAQKDQEIEKERQEKEALINYMKENGINFEELNNEVSNGPKM